MLGSIMVIYDDGDGDDSGPLKKLNHPPTPMTTAHNPWVTVDWPTHRLDLHGLSCPVRATRSGSGDGGATVQLGR